MRGMVKSGIHRGFVYTPNSEYLTFVSALESVSSEFCEGCVHYLMKNNVPKWIRFELRNVDIALLYNTFIECGFAIK